MICSCCNPGISIVICCLGSGGIFGDTGIPFPESWIRLKGKRAFLMFPETNETLSFTIEGGVHGAMIVSQAYSVWWVHRYKRGFQQVRTSDEPTYFSLVWRIKIKIWNLYDEIYPDHKIAHYSYCRNISRKPNRFTDGGSFCLNKQYRISSQNEIPSTKRIIPRIDCTTVPCLPSYVKKKYYFL